MNTTPAPDATVYSGVRFVVRGRRLGVSVNVGEKPLDPTPSWEIRSHSPTGFEWGYCGSGPAQLALAILLDVTADRELSLDAYHWFMRAAVNGFGQSWRITAEHVRRLLAQFAREERFAADRAEFVQGGAA